MRAIELLVVPKSTPAQVALIWRGIDPSYRVVYNTSGQCYRYELAYRFRLVDAKKRSVLQATGHLNCEVCGFDFWHAYGRRGQDFCEVHHRKPISDYEFEFATRLDDLAIVCSNCHRMIDRREPWITIED